jgi:hypothetical protein
MIRREDIFMGSLLESLPYLKSVDQMLNILGVNPDDVHSEKELIGDEMQDITNECITKTNVIENFKIMLKRMNNNSYYNERFN